LSEAFGRFENGMEIVILKKFGSTVLQNFGMNAPSFELRLNRLRSRFGFVKRPCSLALSELAVLSVLQTREGKDGVELLAVRLKLLAPAHEPGWGQKRLYEVDNSVSALVPPLRVEEHPIQPTPLGGLTRLVYQATIMQDARDI
jgi:hypothetical protein